MLDPVDAPGDAGLRTSAEEQRERLPRARQLLDVDQLEAQRAGARTQEAEVAADVRQVGLATEVRSPASGLSERGHRHAHSLTAGKRASGSACADDERRRRAGLDQPAAGDPTALA